MVDIQKLDGLLRKYQESFTEKTYSDENDDHDLLMAAFGISPELKRENRQYWGRELGKCWESLVVEVCRKSPYFKPALKVGNDEPCDLILKNYAIDTKYRVGSGDSGTLKKFKQYGPLLKQNGLEPVFLFLRSDNLPAAITACKNGGWILCIGDESFDFLKEHAGFDLKNYLEERSRKFLVNRDG